MNLGMGVRVGTVRARTVGFAGIETAETSVETRPGDGVRCVERRVPTAAEPVCVVATGSSCRRHRR
jgi:hypothetical protein